MGAAINHGQALLLNGRIQEAVELLQKIDPAQLNPSEANSFHLALFETYLNQREFEKAQEMAARVNRQYLFPTEMKWFEEARQRIPLPPKSGG